VEEAGHLVGNRFGDDPLRVRVLGVIDPAVGKYHAADRDRVAVDAPGRERRVGI
jgi:hypothetical protein